MLLLYGAAQSSGDLGGPLRGQWGMGGFPHHERQAFLTGGTANFFLATAGGCCCAMTASVMAGLSLSLSRALREEETRRHAALLCVGRGPLDDT